MWSRETGKKNVAWVAMASGGSNKIIKLMVKTFVTSKLVTIRVLLFLALLLSKKMTYCDLQATR